MGITMLGGSSTTAASTVPTRRCDAVLDLFESDEAEDRSHAVALCADCPLLVSCRARTRADILRGLAPIGIVQAGVAWTMDGTPDIAVHGNEFAAGWLPALESVPADDGIDPIKVELVFTEPARVRDTLTASERDEVYREGARRAVSLNFLRIALKVHPRTVAEDATRLGIRDCFASKPSKPHKAPVTIIDLDAAAACGVSSEAIEPRESSESIEVSHDVGRAACGVGSGGNSLTFDIRLLRRWWARRPNSVCVEVDPRRRGQRAAALRSAARLSSHRVPPRVSPQTATDPSVRPSVASATGCTRSWPVGTRLSPRRPTTELAERRWIAATGPSP
ncbi:hypothetical protein [Nocardia sp. NPDC052566]|uniref:hypothetical protein n=1 Tax=Nocardia sp. NPDC052566 TaxID=3364330 RepID=UPI0037CC1458